MKYREKIFKSTLVSVYIFYICIFLFARTFMGISIFGFRIGEISMLVSFLFLVIPLLFLKNSIIFQLILNSKIYYTLIFLISSFIVYIFISDGSFLNLYIYKASSYIWTIGFLFLGIYISTAYSFKIEKFYIFLLILVFIYYYSIYGISSNIQNLFLNFSDKFEYHKGSDILIMFVAVFFITNRTFSNKRVALEIFISLSAIFLPLMLYKSRGAFISLVLYVILEAIYLRKFFKVHYLRNISLAIIFLLLSLQSIFIVNKSGFLKLFEVEEKVDFLVTYRQVPLEESSSILYVKDGRLFSGDGNFNWRLQIWQDIVSDLLSTKKLFIGYGYNSKIPAMDDPFRSGDDGTNENVHNFLINILARGGLLHLFTFIVLMFLLIKKAIYVNGLNILNFVSPIFVTSLLDSSMENSHFPLIFYFLLGYTINHKFKK